MADATPCSPANCGEAFTRCGTSTGYGYWKCRCVKCREANAAKQRKQNKRTAVRPPSDPATFDHGTIHGYKYHKCRCEACVEACRVHDRERYRTKRADSQREYSRQYRQENREQCDATINRWKSENSDKCREYRHRSYENNKPKRLADAKKWRAENPEKVRESHRRHWENNKDKRRASSRAWHKRNPDYNANAKKRRRAQKSGATAVKFTVEQWDQKKSYWGTRCHLQIPGRCTGGADTMDHVKPLIAGGVHMLANLRPACLPCNASKRDKWPYEVKLIP